MYTPGNILVTGGAGFTGSHFVNKLIDHYKNQNKVVVVDRLDYPSLVENWTPQTLESKRFSFEKVDICDKLQMYLILSRNKIDTVLHFAAQTHVDHSFTNSDQFIKDNILGTHNLLQACKEWGGIKRFLHVSTDEVYGEVPFDQKEGCKENYPLYPTNPYAATKAGAEFIAWSFMKSFGIPIVMTRCNNIYGWGQYPDKIIPKFATLLANGEKLSIHGRGTAKRNFIHVSDVTNACIVLLEKGKIGETYNIGTSNEFSVMEIAEQMVKLFHGVDAKVSSFIEYVPDRNFNDCRYHVNAEKLVALGWREIKPFAIGFRETVDWYRQKLRKAITKT